MFCAGGNSYSFRECAAAIVEPRLKKNWPGSITFRSRARRLKKVLTVRFNPQTQQSWLDALQWGLIPYWAKDPKIAYRTINARAETIDKAPSFRQAFIKRRCFDHIRRESTNAFAQQYET